MINLGWLGKSVVATLIFVMFYLLIGIIGRQFDTQPESIIAYYIIGAAVGIALWLVVSGQTGILKLTKPTLLIFLLGLTLGALANIYLIQAVIGDHNPGIPATIIGSCGVFVYFAGGLLAIVLPKYFEFMTFNRIDLIGVMLIFFGIGIISLKQYIK